MDNKKNTNKTCSFVEAKQIVGEYIEESAKRLQKRLQREWAKKH